MLAFFQPWTQQLPAKRHLLVAGLGFGALSAALAALMLLSVLQPSWRSVGVLLLGACAVVVLLAAVWFFLLRHSAPKTADGLDLQQAFSLLHFDLSFRLDMQGNLHEVRSHDRLLQNDSTVLADLGTLDMHLLAKILRQVGLDEALHASSFSALQHILQKARAEGQADHPKWQLTIQRHILEKMLLQSDLDGMSSSTQVMGAHEFMHSEISLGTPQIGADKRWFEVKALRLTDKNHEWNGYWVGCTDVTHSHAAEESQRLISLVFERAGEGIVVTDAARKIIQINQSFTEVTGYLPQDVLGEDLSDFMSDADQPHLMTQMWYAVESQGRWRGEMVSRRKNGQFYTKVLSVVPLCDDEQRILHYVCIFSEISELKLAKSELVYQAYYDALTGLPNRRKLKEELLQGLQLRKDTGRLLALMVIDIDDFKDINDSQTHRQGDALLASTAHCLETTLRNGDTVYRLGGDEFAILLERLATPDDADIVAKRIQALFDHPIPLEDDVEVMVRISIGIVVGPTHGETPEELMQHADTALHRAKSEGKNRVAFYSENLTKAAKMRLSLDRNIRRALENREFVLHYQPQISLSDDKATGVEALVRWKDPHRASLVYPDEFIAESERTGLVVELGTQVLEMACRQGRAWIDKGFPTLHMAVNVSAKQLKANNFVAVVVDVLERTGFPADQLEIEITESSLIGDIEKTLAVLMMLRDLGISLAVDDFGTGYSSLSYLQRFPLTKLKIDRSFVNQLPDIGAGCAISQAIVNLSHSLGMTVQAEGVETERQLQALRDLGCEYYQGYLAGRPMAADAFELWLSARGMSQKSATTAAPSAAKISSVVS